jgi:hypothetical protein
MKKLKKVKIPVPMPSAKHLLQLREMAKEAGCPPDQLAWRFLNAIDSDSESYEIAGGSGIACDCDGDGDFRDSDTHRNG